MLGHAFQFSANHSFPSFLYPAPIASFPDIPHCITKMVPLLPPPSITLVHGLIPGSRVGVSLLPGFPSMHTIPHTATLGFHGVNVFNTESLRESMIISLINRFEGRSVEDIARKLIGTSVFISEFSLFFDVFFIL